MGKKGRGCTGPDFQEQGDVQRCSNYRGITPEM